MGIDMKKVWKFFEDHMSPIIVVLAFLLVILYTVTNIIIQVKGVSLSDTLTEWVFKFFGLELIALSGIKVSKHIGSAFGRYDDAIDGCYVDDEEGGEDDAG